MTITHPKLGECEQIGESPPFIRITHPQHNYDFWILKTELEIDEKSAGETRAEIYARTKAGEKRSREEEAPFDEACHGAWFTRPLRLEKDACVRPQVGARAQTRVP
jgi:hypothetical protein